MTNFALEHVCVYAACFLADIVLTDAVAHDVGGGLDPSVIEDAMRLGLFVICFLVVFFLFRLWGFCHNLILLECLNCIWHGFAAHLGAFRLHLFNQFQWLFYLDQWIADHLTRHFDGYFLTGTAGLGHLWEDFVEEAAFVFLGVQVAKDLISAPEELCSSDQTCRLLLQ